MDKPLDIFRPGRHTAMSGATLTFSEADLAKTAAAYDPALHEAPLVVGHPTADAPAYGWVKSLAFADGHLQAEPQQVDEAFAEMVEKGRFKKMSGSFYRPDAPSNPVPGVYYLRHIGFLGAQPPAVKGLRDASFAEDDQSVTVEFGELTGWSLTTLGDGLRTLREWLIGKFGLVEADKALPSYVVGNVERAAAQPDEPDDINPPSYAEGAKPTPKEARMSKDLERREAELKEKEADLNKKTATFAEQEAALKAKQLETQKAEHLAFAERLVKEGKLNPSHKEPLVAFMATITPEDTLSFGEGDGAKTEPTLGWLKGLLEAQPKQLAFGEAAPGGGGEAPSSADFAAPPGCEVDAAGLELHAKAMAHMKANPTVTFLDAVKAVS